MHFQSSCPSTIATCPWQNKTADQRRTNSHMTSLHRMAVDSSLYRHLCWLPGNYYLQSITEGQKCLRGQKNMTRNQSKYMLYTLENSHTKIKQIRRAQSIKMAENSFVHIIIVNRWLMLVGRSIMVEFQNPLGELYSQELFDLPSRYRTL